MNVLLTGATGLLGRAVFARLSARNDMTLTGTALSRAREPFAKLDITDPAAVEALFAARRPDFVIHAAAERRPDAVDDDPGRARAINVTATGTMAAACARYGAALLYISTDYVFDGSNPPYFPDSPVHPINAYGELKLEGERLVEKLLPPDKAIILRIPLLYGPVERLEECSVTELAKRLLTKTPCSVEHWASRYPIHVDDVAAAIEKIAAAYASAFSANVFAANATAAQAAPRARAGVSIFQLSGPVAYTKYEMLMVMARVLGIDAAHVSPNAEPPRGAPRPKDCRMDTSLLESLGYKPSVGFDEAIGRIIAPHFAS